MKLLANLWSEWGWLMVNIEVRAEIAYQVEVGGEWRTFLDKVLGSHKKVLIVAPAYIVEVAALQSLVAASNIYLFVTPDGEAQKEYATLERIWTLLGSEEFGRTDALVAIGGGATTDLGGFAAASWLRGIAWYAIPTTLAGMVDASVGGKTGINTAAGKNLVGAFYSPRGVCADISWLETLSDRDFSAGLAEVIKTGYIRDLTILELLKASTSLADARAIAYELVAKSVAVKAAVFSADFKEGKLREILNFGHTLGHALEKSSNYSLRHGEAVSLGLHFAALLSQSELGFSEGDVVQLRALLEKFGLPTTVRTDEYEFADLLALMVGDKKSRDGRIRFVGLRSPGEPDWIEAATPEILTSTYEKIAL